MSLLAITEHNTSYIHQINNNKILLLNRAGVTPNPVSPIDPNDPPVIPIDPVPAILGKHQCGISCIGMLLNFWLKKELTSPGLYNSTNLASLYSAYDSNYINNVQPRLPLSSKFESSLYWLPIIQQIFTSKGLNPVNYNFIRSSNNSVTFLQDVITDVQKGCPVIVPTKLTKSGHFIIIIGYDPNVNSFIVNDPFYTFNFKKNKYDKPVGGRSLYPKDTLLSYLVQASQAGGSSGITMIYITKK